MAEKYKIMVYKCLECCELISEFDIEEHCMECSATIEDFEEVGEYIVEADNLSEACDKAIEIAKSYNSANINMFEEVDSDDN